MTITAITPPSGAIPGKTFGVDSSSGLLMITNPAIDDFLATRSIYVEYSIGAHANKLCLMGSAFAEYLALLDTLGVTLVTTSVSEYALSIVSQRIRHQYIVKQLRGANNGKCWAGIAGVALSTYTPAVTVTKVCAVPHRMVSGMFGTVAGLQSWMAYRNSSTGAHTSGDRNVSPNPATEYYTDGMPMTRACGFGNDSGFSFGQNPTSSLPTYVAALRSGKSYTYVLDTILGTIDLPSGVKTSARAAIVAALKAHGVQMGADVPHPFIVGGFANALRILGDAIGNGAATAWSPYVHPVGPATTATMKHQSIAHYGSLVPIGDGTTRVPVPLLGDYALNNGTLYIATPYSDDAASPYQTWTETSTSLTATCGGELVREILGHQPFDVFYSAVGKPRSLLGETSLTARNSRIMAINNQSNQSDPTSGFAASTGNTIAAQQLAWGTSAIAADTGLNDTATIGEAYMVTARTLIRLCFDALECTADSIQPNAERLSRVLRGNPFALCT